MRVRHGQSRGQTSGTPAPLSSDRLFGRGEDPLTWSIPFDPFLIGRVLGVRVRWHVVFPLWVGAEVVSWLPHDAFGPVHVACMLIAAAVLIYMRELGRVLLARTCGADQDQVVLWPAGGIVEARTPGTRRPLLAEAGGLLTSALLFPLLGWLVIWSGAAVESLIFNPLAPRVPASGLRSAWQAAAWWAYYVNGMLLIGNLLLPMVPFDLGRMLRSWIASRRGREQAVVWSTRLGLIASVSLFVLASSAGETRLMALAVFTAIVTWIEFRRADFVEMTGLQSRRADAPSPATVRVTSEPTAPIRPTTRPAPHPVTILDLDSVLSKIAAKGINSLTEQERDLLSRETQKRRGSGDSSRP